MADSQELKLPPQTDIADPGAHQLAEASDSDDQFTDAQSVPQSPNICSPIPETRVEKVDDEPSHGEVPGTEAYRMREQDAKPDQIAIISDEASESSSSTPQNMTPIPTAVIEEPSGEHLDRHSADHQDNRRLDTPPDILLIPDEGVKGGDEGTHANVPLSPASSPGRLRKKSSSDGDDNFDDDFDDFEDGAQDDDFDDFEDGFQHAETTAAATPVQPQSTLPFPIPDFDGLSPDEVISTIEPCLHDLFPPEELDFPPFPTLSKDSSIFLTPRSASLWSQLVAPPPLAPPDWIRSRTRRLFLVSLGVPVDLDEILPASKQKKLVLPSLNVPATSPRASSDLRSASRLKQGEGNASSTSVDSQGRPSTSKRRKGPSPQPALDLVAARHLCQTTDEALDGMTNEELKEHVSKLEVMQGAAKEVLDYWTKRTDEKIGDREAFEGVIENLVAHARKVRK